MASSTIPEKFLDLLTTKKPLANIATIMPDGTPQVTPVWFDYTNGKIRINTARGRVKAKNMKVGAKVALAIVDPDNVYRYIGIRGPVISRRREERRRAYRQPGEEVPESGQISVPHAGRKAGDVRDRAGIRARHGLTRPESANIENSASLRSTRRHTSR